MIVIENELGRFKDCSQCVNEFFNYEREVLNGFIVQSYYEITEEELGQISLRDSYLIQLAFEFGGKHTGEGGIRLEEKRRDLDFRFEDIKNASNFKLCLPRYNYYVHKQINRDGNLEDLDLKKLETYKAQLIQNNC